ncbi:MAG: hydantoinase/oxoprolinase family protein [Woeseiaceae bacterium]|nr:hydantoinase/oxoprolinase family protein [Woeseiaceae bacterium]
MLSNGGVVGARVASMYPVRMIESGPAAGALVAGYMARKLGLESLISFDMGGTTAKACLIQGAEPMVVGEFEVDRQYLLKPGSGIPVTVPSIDMIEIGAGGGSIARVDSLGLLKVGPQSAGSDPGPACYGRGGSDACVTDADVVLGILDPANFLGGTCRSPPTRRSPPSAGSPDNWT